MAFDPRLACVILVLLAGNTAYYVIAGRLSEALDSLAWYALLILFALESLRSRRPRAAVLLMHGVRGLATLAIAVSAVLYVREGEWLDAINVCLWIAVVLLLEIEVRHPARVAARRQLFSRVAAGLYGTLAVLVLIWLAQGAWMDAWDAAVWLTAFGALERGLLSRSVSQNNV